MYPPILCGGEGRHFEGLFNLPTILKSEEDSMAGKSKDKGDEGRTPKQDRQNERKLRRKLARAVEDVAYGLKYHQDSAYGAAAYGRQRYAAGDRPGAQGNLKSMLDDELGDLFS